CSSDLHDVRRSRRHGRGSGEPAHLSDRQWPNRLACAYRHDGFAPGRRRMDLRAERIRGCDVICLAATRSPRSRARSDPPRSRSERWNLADAVLHRGIAARCCKKEAEEDRMAADTRRANMTIRGKVKNGRVVLDKPRAFPDGTEVEVRRAKTRKRPAKKAKPAKPKPRPRSLADRLRNVIGKAKHLPPD